MCVRVFMYVILILKDIIVNIVSFSCRELVNCLYRYVNI